MAAGPAPATGEPTASERLQDRSIRHALYLERYKGGLTRREIGRANSQEFPEIQGRLVATLEGVRRRGPQVTTRSHKRLREGLERIDALSAEQARSRARRVQEQLDELAAEETGFEEGLLAAILGAQVVRRADRSARRRAARRAFEGGTTQQWIRGIGALQRTLVRRAVQIGIQQGETTDQIVGRVRGPVFRRLRRETDTILRSAVAAVHAAAREEVWAANPDEIIGVQWVVTLDTRTCPTCMGRGDGTVYPVGEGPRPPAHHRCRCTTSPVRRGDRPPKSLTYNAWLHRQPAAIQNEALGPTRAKAFRRGDLQVGDFTDRGGRILTIRELRAREPDAFPDAS